MFPITLKQALFKKLLLLNKSFTGRIVEAVSEANEIIEMM